MSYCVDVHTDPDQYPWLNDVNGGIESIEFEEPAGSGKWYDYTIDTWNAHCDPDIVDHYPSELLRSHMDAFINPRTRFARVKYHFNNGTAREPRREDYIKEAQWFFEQGEY